MSKKSCGAGLLCTLWLVAMAMASDRAQLRVGAAAVAITPFGQNADWDGGVTESGVWGEKFVDKNHNGGGTRANPSKTIQ